jgi:PAS domain S-box-containing protein
LACHCSEVDILSQRILVIEAEEAVEDVEHDARSLEQQLRTLEVATARTTVSESMSYLKKAVFAGEDPAVVIIGPTVPAPLLVARQMRSLSAKGHIIFVASAGQMAALQRELARAPMIGTDWSLAIAGDTSLPKLVADAVRATQRRFKLRTTLDRANIQIHAPKSVDSAEYRRLVVSDHYLASLLTQAQDIIISLDASQRIVFLSAGAAKLAGTTPELAAGRLLKNTPLWACAMAGYLERIRAAKQALTAEFTLSLENREMLVETVFSAVRDDHGSLIGTSLFMRDVTERYRQLEAERLARAEAESIGRLKDDFLTTLSHELRTPLNSILGWAQLLRMGSLPEQKRVDGIATIERNARHQAKLIEDLLDVSSVITGKLRLQLQPIGLRGIVDRAAEAALPEALAKGVTLSVMSDVAIDLVNGDAHRLQQVMCNLLSNALKFTPKGGSIRVSMRQVQSAMYVAVTDTGEGLSPTFLPHAFERFRQADASITKKKGGLGLGLSIVKQLVEMHGGSVTASSAGVGHGATFIVELPLANGTSVVRDQPEALRGAGNFVSALEGMRILIVDDEPDALELVAYLFEKHGAGIKTAASAAEALQVIEAFNPQLLISDIGMPNVDGYELLRTIRTQVPNGKNLPAIALTAFADQANREKALMTGFQNHIGKPFEASELLKMAAGIAKAVK